MALITTPHEIEMCLHRLAELLPVGASCNAYTEGDSEDDKRFFGAVDLPDGARITVTLPYTAEPIEQPNPAQFGGTPGKQSPSALRKSFQRGR